MPKMAFLFAVDALLVDLRAPALDLLSGEEDLSLVGVARRAGVGLELQDDHCVRENMRRRGGPAAAYDFIYVPMDFR